MPAATTISLSFDGAGFPPLAGEMSEGQRGHPKKRRGDPDIPSKGRPFVCDALNILRSSYQSVTLYPTSSNQPHPLLTPCPTNSA